MTPPRQKKKREINWQAVEHVGNDADEGGFLGDEEAERERSEAKPVAVVPSPASEQAARSDVAGAVIDAPTKAAAGAPAEPTLSAGDQATSGSTPERGEGAGGATDIVADQFTDVQAPVRAGVAESAVVSKPAVEMPQGQSDAVAVSSDSTPPAEPALVETAPALFPPRSSRPRVNDGPLFTSAGAEPPVVRAPARRAKLKPTQSLVVASFLDQRTKRNWAMWSGRLVPDVTKRLEDRAFADATSSDRSRLKSGHYLDAALKALPEDPEEIVEIANDWLIERWGGEHPPGVNAQFSVSPEARERLANLKRSLRGYRHGIIIDVVSAAVDRILDVLDQEGPLKG
ncbi:hypothetical protein AB0L67_40055 [Streptomyces flaveolus]|uniref:hypothetical protein n=1 Tax=Streptomyces flaveolus TaxID=67297 RepID=UPI003435BBF5